MRCAPAPVTQPRQPALPALLLALACAVLAGAPDLAAQPVVTLGSDTTVVDLPPHAAYLKDPSPALTIDATIAPPVRDQFTPWSGGAIPSFGFTSATHWFRFRLASDASVRTTWFVEVGRPLINSIGFYVVADGRIVTRKEGGNRVPAPRRDVPVRPTVFSVTLEPGARADVYMAFRSEAALWIPLRLWAPDRFWAHYLHEELWDLLFFGYMLALSIVGAFLAIAARDKAYLYYTLTTAVFVGYLFTSMQYPAFFDLPGLGFWGGNGIMLLAGLAAPAYLMYTRSFLRLAELEPRLDRFARWAAVVSVAAVFVTLPLPYAVMAPVITFQNQVCLVIGFVVSALFVVRGNRTAITYMAAWSVFLIAMLLRTCASFGLAPAFWALDVTAQWTSMLGYTLFLLALADRVRTLDLDKLAAQAELLAHQTSERARAEDLVRTRTAELEETRDYLDNLLNYANAPVVVWDAAFKITRFNRAFERLTGLRADEVIGGDLDVLFPADTRQASLAYIRTTTGERWETVEIAIAHRDGTVRTLLWNSATLYAPDRTTVVATIAQGHDISERKRTEEALRASEARYRTLFERVPIGLYSTTPAARVLDCNPAAVRIFGYASRDQALGADVRDLYLHPHDRERVLASLGATGAGEFEVEMRRADGTTFWAYHTVQVVRDGDGRILHLEGSLQDVTARKQAEEALRASEATARALLDATADPAFLTDPSGAILVCNEAASRNLGDRGPLLGVNCFDLLEPDLARSRRQYLDEALATREPVHFTSHWRGRWFENSIHPVLDPLRRVVKVAFYGHDITQRKASEAALLLKEEQLRQSQKMEAMGNLAGGVAHDFNNLLQAMLGQSQFLRTHADNPARVRHLAGELDQQVRRGASLTRQLLMFSRRETVKPERLDLNESVRDATDMLRRLVRANIALAVELVAGQLPVESDRGQLGQILMNLAVNASDAMPDGGTLTIRTGVLDDREVWLSLEDTGHGIPENIRDRIFDPFFTTKGVGRGTGLGLSVVHGIVTQHGGRIDVESRIGKGTMFRVVFPRASGEAPPETAGDAPDRGEVATGQRERILIVEDEDAAREGLRELVTMLGYDVVAALGSGEEAVALHEAAHADLLLTDFMLPGMTGNSLAAVLTGRWPELKVILMSGYTQDEAVRRGVTAHEIRYIQKPFDMDTLAREIRAALDERPI